MNEILFPYQKEGAEWLSRKRYCLLADDMGLGKSAQAITAAELVGSLPVLILTPAVGRLNFLREFEKFSTRSLNICALLTAADKSKVPNADVVICSYDLAQTAGVHAALSSRAWSITVLDEVHFLKSATANRTSRVFGPGGLIHRSERVWCLSGTPAPLHPGELWVMLYCLGVTKLSQPAFTERYTTGVDLEVRPGVWSRKVTGGRNLSELRALLAPFMLRRKKEDVMADLPPIRFNDVTVEPAVVDNFKWSTYFDNYLSYGPRGRSVFEADVAKAENTVKTLLSDVGMGAPGQKIMEGLADKPEIKSLRRWVGLQKVGSVIQMVAAELEANAYQKIVLFACHRDVIEELEIGLKKFGAAKIYGGTPPNKRDRGVQKFQNDPKCRVFIGQILAAGTSITLTAASEVGIVEADWTPGNNAQAIMRVHRYGQKEKVNCRFFAVAGYDEKITRVLKQRARTLTELFDVPATEVADPFAAV